MITRRTLLLVILLLLAWSWMARPIYDWCWIALKRERDNAVEKVKPPANGIPYDDVVALNTRTVSEIDGYLTATRELERQSPLVTQLDYSSPAAYQSSTAPLRAELAHRLHYPLPDAIHGDDFSGVNQTPAGEDDVATYSILAIPALPGVSELGTLIEPKKHGAKMPLIIANYGKGGMPDPTPTGKISVMKYYDRDLARGAVERGWAVFEPIFAFYATNQPTNIRDMLTLRAQEAGITLTTVEITKLVRSIDYLTSRPEIDAGHVAMVGLSYGGFHTLYTAALDARIQVAVVTAYFNDRAGILDDTEPVYGYLDWRFSDSAGLFIDPHVVALVCPRPLQIQSGNQDQLFPLAGSERAIPEARSYYEQLHLESNFEFYKFTGRHDFNGTPAWTFIAHAWQQKP